MARTMRLSFCLPQEHVPNVDWVKAFEKGKVLPLEEEGKSATSHCWIYQTWALLIGAKVPCHLFHEMPKEGMIIALSGSLSTFLGVNPPLPKNVFLVDVVADALPHPAAHLHIVQNRAHARRLPRSLFIPHWPQPHLIPRNPERGHRFEHVCFFGDASNLAPELRTKAWSERLRHELGITFELRKSDQWHDYSDVDGVIAIRNFSIAGQFHKPATKLYNAWLAGVPFIGGRDSAYKADGHPGRDYLIATSAEEVFQQLKQLKEDTTFRSMLVEKGLQTGAAFTREATLKHWKIVIQKTLPALASEWQQASTIKRYWFSTTQRFFCWADRYLRS